MKNLDAVDDLCENAEHPLLRHVATCHRAVAHDGPHEAEVIVERLVPEPHSETWLVWWELQDINTSR